MKAAVLREYGVPRFEEFDEPSPAEGAEMVELLAASLTTLDVRAAAGGHPMSPRQLPVVCGVEGVGRTADGRRVYVGAPVPPYGTMAQHVPADPSRLFDVPEGLDDAVAAALGNAGWAAWLPLSWRAGLIPGERVLILGATGVVGRLAVQAARLQGAGMVVAAGRDPAALAETTDLGADATVQLDSGDDLTAAFTRAAGGPVDIVLDYVGGQPLAAALGASATGVRMVQVGDAADPQLRVPAALLRAKGVSLFGFVPRLAGPQAMADSYAQLAAHVLAGRLRVEVERHPLAEVAAVWGRRSRRRIVLVPPEATS